MEFIQAQLDSSPAWVSPGRDAAVLAVSRLAPLLLTSTGDQAFVWDVCQHVLRSRGVFWAPDADTIERFFHQVKFEPDELFNTLSKWLHEATLVEIATSCG